MEKEEDKSPHSFHQVPSWWSQCIVVCSSGVRTAAGPAGKSALHAGQGLASASRIIGKQLALPRLPCHLQQEQLSSWLWGLCFCKSKGCAFGSQTFSMWFCGQSKLQWLLGVCIFLHQRDKLLRSPFVLRPLLHMPYCFLNIIFVSGELLI